MFESSKLQVPPFRFHHLNIEVVGPLPIDAANNQYLLTMIDRFTRYITIVPLKDTTSRSIITAFNQNYVSVFGIPSVITTDNASYFKSKEFVKFTRNVGIKMMYAIPYSPWMNGMIERVHSKLKPLV